jgi:SAM-dependent methyltransferase
MGDYYPDNYEPHAIDRTGPTSWHGQRMRRIQLSFIEEYLPIAGCLLDVGSATGNFLAAARDRGWTVQGIELSREAAVHARDTYGLATKVGAVEDLLDEKEVYDVITMWDVLEHLRDPRNALSKCHRALKDGGILVMSIPNMTSFDRYLFDSTWVGWEVPRHLYFFDKHTLERLLNEIGFNIIGNRSFLGGRGAFEISLMTRFNTGLMSQIVEATLPLILAFTWPYRKISYWSGKGSVQTFVAEKRSMESKLPERQDEQLD